MKRIASFAICALLIFGGIGSASAGPLEDAAAAYLRKDYATALRLLRPLAEEGNESAQHILGVIYGQGQGVPQDYVEAVKWYRKAAEQGNATAQLNLGANYAQGLGVPQDYVRAHMWFNLAAINGDEKAVKNRELAASMMAPEQIAEAQKLAREWKPKKQAAE